MKAFVSDPLDLSRMNPETDLDGIQAEHALGFLTCTPDLNCGDMLASIAGKYPVPIVGGTVLGNPFDTGAEPFISRFSVLGKKALRRHVALSGPITPGNSRRQIQDAHRQCVEALDGDVKMFFVMLPLLPELYPGLYIDPFLAELFECAGDVPVFGGTLSDEFHATRSAIFHGGEQYHDRILLIALGGDIRPAFGIGSAMTVPSDNESVVTAAHENYVDTVDNMPFVEYLRKAGLDESAIADFPASLRVRTPDAGPDEPFRIQALTAIDPVTGAGCISGAIPAGSTIGLGYITTGNIIESTEACLDRLAADMERQKGDGYRYETLFGVSCLARYYMLFGQEPVEAEGIDRRLPECQARFGYYGFNEICPVRRTDGSLENRKHGKALALCAI